MIDYSELKRLALAAPAGPWYPPDEHAHKGTVFDCDLGSLLSYESIDTERDTCVAYVAAANPAAVLELIAENNRLRDGTLAERYDQLKAENDAARKELKNLRSDNAQLIYALKQQEQSYLALRDERDQLKAENESLRQQLAIPSDVLADAEALRRDAERYRWLRGQHWNDSAICVVTEPKQSTKLGAYCPSGDLLDDAIDAALVLIKEVSHD